MKDIFLVIQHQPDEPEYDNTTIYTYDNREAAEECAKRLNLEYAKGVILDEEGLYLDTLVDEESYHYYEVEASALESVVDDEVYNPANDKTNEHAQVYVIALYNKETMEFIGYYGNPITQDKDKATYYNDETSEAVAAYLEDNEDYSTEVFHYTKADDAK